MKYRYIYTNIRRILGVFIVFRVFSSVLRCFLVRFQGKSMFLGVLQGNPPSFIVEMPLKVGKFKYISQLMNTILYIPYIPIRYIPCASSCGNTRSLNLDTTVMCKSGKCRGTTLG